MNIAHPKTDIRRTFLAKLSFEFMAVIVTIELGFRQQVVAEALKYLLKVSVRSKSRDGSLAVSLFYHPNSPDTIKQGNEKMTTFLIGRQ
jgi:hypothetical protein